MLTKSAIDGLSCQLPLASKPRRRKNVRFQAGALCLQMALGTQKPTYSWIT
jgi:hypothetical protein